eukprot:6204994-Pleurochrysis_carterae.AAC.1
MVACGWLRTRSKWTKSGRLLLGVPPTLHMLIWHNSISLRLECLVYTVPLEADFEESVPSVLVTDVAGSKSGS